MRLAYCFGLLAIAALSFGAALPAQAEVEYPWCVVHGGVDGGTESCGFVSYEQCMETARGLGFCRPNVRYHAQVKPIERPKPHRHY